MFPADNVWNVTIDSLPTDANSGAYVQTIGPDAGIRRDFGAGLHEGEPIGISYMEVPGDQPKLAVQFEYAG